MIAIFAALYAVLALASIVGYGLQRRHPSPAVENLNARIRAWWVMIIAGGLVLWAGRYAIIGLFACLSLMAFSEFIAPLRWRDWWPCFFLVLPAQYLWIALDQPWAVTLWIPLACLLARNRRIQGGLLLCVAGLSYVPALLMLPGDRRSLVLYLVLVVQASDVLQYLWGRLLGRHPIAPRISPAKTVEGFLGGVACASLIGGLLWYLTPFPPVTAVVTALLITTMGFLSGLLLSAIKRDRGIKDWGTSLPGHGGMLDRVDSLCLSAPVFYYVTRHLNG